MKKLLFIVVILGAMAAAPLYADGANSDILAGNEAAMAENYDLAINYYSKAIDSGSLGNKQLAVAYNNRGCAYDDSNREQEALKDFARAISLDSGYDAPYFNRSFIYERNKNYAAAIKDMQKAISLDPSYDDYKVRLEWLQHVKDLP